MAGIPHPEGNPLRLEGVEWLGHFSAQQMAALYAESSILIHPARYEPFGLVPLEAALAGCALVLGKIDTLQEVWGDAAIFVDPDDDEQLAHQVNHLIQNTTLRRHYAAKAHRRAKNFSSERMGRRYLNAYHRLLSQTRSETSRPICPSASASLQRN